MIDNALGDVSEKKLYAYTVRYINYHNIILFSIVVVLLRT